MILNGNNKRIYKYLYAALIIENIKNQQIFANNNYFIIVFFSYIFPKMSKQ